MAKINTELTYNNLDPKITKGIPQIEFIVKDRTITASEIDILTPHNILLTEFTMNKLFYWVNVTSGSGTPAVKVKYYAPGGLHMITVTPSSSPYEFAGTLIAIVIEETGGVNPATYDALLKII